MSATVVQLKPPSTVSESRIETLFHEHKRLIFQTAYRVTGNAAEAEDVLQTIFLRLMQQQNDGSEHAEEKLTGAYLHRAAINCALDSVRKRRRRADVPLEVVASTAADADARDPQSAREQSELRDLLRAAIARLNPKAAETFVLRYFEGKSNNEIAEALGTSPFVVAVTLHRARTRLRIEVGKFMEKYDEAK